MPSALEGARRSTPPAELVSRHDSDALLAQVQAWLDEAKAENVVTIDIRGKSSIGDYMVIASGRSDRHVGAIAEQLQRKLKDEGYGPSRIEGQPQCDWVLIDMGDIIVHVFRPEVREFYNLEKMWSAERPSDPAHALARLRMPAGCRALEHRWPVRRWRDALPELHAADHCRRRPA